MEQFKGYWNLVNCTIAELGTMDAHKLCQEVVANTGVHFDWHPFSNHLDHLATVGFMKRVGFGKDGQIIYEYIPEEERS